VEGEGLASPSLGLKSVDRQTTTLTQNKKETKKQKTKKSKEKKK